jgi:hypothetical protein
MAQEIKKLNEADLAKLRSLEGKLGSWVVVLEQQRNLASISEEQLNELKALEKELHAILVAYSH